MSKRPTPANAAAITRALVAGGMRKGTVTKASRGVVRGGYATFGEGVVSTQVMDRKVRKERNGTYGDGSPRYRNVVDNTPTGVVEVEWQFTTNRAPKTTEEVIAVQRERLTQASDILRAKGFDVSEPEHRGTQRLVIEVRRLDADGNVVQF